MTTTTARNAIVRGERMANRGPRGGRSYAGVKGLLNYLAFGRHADRRGRDPVQRGAWLDHNGRERSHREVLGWAKAKVHRYGYPHTYQLLLSTRHGGLDAADYNRALAEGSALSGVREWVYTVHEDTEHQHAHAILFRKERMSRAQYRTWQAAMQNRLEQAVSTQARFAEAGYEAGFHEAKREQRQEEAFAGKAAGVAEQRERPAPQMEQDVARGRGRGMGL